LSCDLWSEERSMQLRHARPFDAKPPSAAEPRHEDEGERVMMRHMHHLL